MSWKELSISVPHEFVEPVSYLFSRYGKSLSTEPQGAGRVMLRTYLESGSRQRLARIDVGVRLVASVGDLGELVVRELDDGEDWQNSWKEHYGALPVGSRLIIKPSWVELEDGAADGRVVIELDPGIAFGTGYHPTTYTCMEALEELVLPGMRVLDLGSGSGILTITALKLGAASAVALDIDGQAVSAARQNFRRLRLQDRVTLAKGSVPHPAAAAGTMDLAVANISARGVADRVPFLLQALRPGGMLVASGMLGSQRPEVDDAVLALGFTPELEWPREDWLTLGYRAPEGTGNPGE
jgi:ribosomal protein L11 methyltransferase